MPGACLSLWPTDECEWSIAEIWGSSDLIQRAIYIGLALMLGYTLFAVIRFSRRRHLARRDLHDFKPDDFPNFRRASSEFLADLSPGIGMLKGIASAAPFLGLAGTCYGFLASFQDVSGSRASVIAYLVRVMVHVPVSTLAGILVAMPAAFTYNLLRARVETLRYQLPGPKTNAGLGSFQLAQMLPLKKRFLGLPPFAVLGAPFLALAVMAWMSLKPYGPHTGLPVRLAPDCGEFHGDYRSIVLRITQTEKMSINFEPVDRQDLVHRLSAIYGTHAYRNLYIYAEDGVPVQTVADAIDSAENTPIPGAESPTITVLLITSKATEARCPKIFAVHSRLRGLR